MSTPEDLVTAIKDRLDEIERRARNATRTTRRPGAADEPAVVPQWRTIGWGGAEVADERGGIAEVHNGRIARHIVLHDPSSVLRRVQADRRVLARHWLMLCDHCPLSRRHFVCTAHEQHADFPCDEIKDLADGLGIDLPEDTDG